MPGKVQAGHNENMREKTLEYARELVRQLEAGDCARADNIIDELLNCRETNLYREIGKLTRELHEKINSFIDDSHLRTIMQHEIPDARERLSYVIKLTEESAHSTLTAVEHGMPLVTGLGARAMEIKDQWHDFMHHNKGVDGLRSLTTELDEYLQRVIDETRNIHEDLSDVLMAQSYQDITGQVIQRVINLVHTVEQSLVGIIKTSGKSIATESQKPADKDNSGHGPVVPGVTGGDVMKSQDDVDDLLSTLGF